MPALRRRWTRLPIVGAGGRAQLGDRLTGRLWDYPRWLRPKRGDFDVFHIVDHSYAHLVRVLPADRTVVTCHDLDAIQAALPRNRWRLDPARLLATPAFARRVVVDRWFLHRGQVALLAGGIATRGSAA